MKCLIYFVIKQKTYGLAKMLVFLLMLFKTAGSDAARLNVDTFTQMNLVKLNGTATFNCEYTNALITEWYFDQKKITNNTEQQK